MTLPNTKRLPLHPSVRSDGSRDYRPTYVVWEITLRCDQACHFCGTRAGHARPDELSTQECLDVVKQLAVMGTREVALHGGEAYLRPDWLDIVRAVHDNGMDCTMVTGGRGFSPQVARDAKSAGMNAISVSIDGPQDTHDELRGLRGSYSNAIAAVRHIADAGIKVGCNTQVNRRNMGSLPDIVDVLTSFSLYGWQVQLMVPMGRAADAPDLWLQPFDILDVIPAIAKARRICDERGLRLWPGDNVGYFGPCEQTLRRDRTRHGHSGGCGGGIITMGIEAHGGIKGCSAMSSDGFIGGNVRTQAISDIWQNATELRFVRDFKIDDLWGFCRTCYYAEVCKGGCLWTASTLLGRRGNNPYCHHRALEYLAMGKRERLHRTKEALGLVRDRALFETILEDAPP